MGPSASEKNLIAKVVVATVGTIRAPLKTGMNRVDGTANLAMTARGSTRIVIGSGGKRIMNQREQEVVVRGIGTIAAGMVFKTKQQRNWKKNTGRSPREHLPYLDRRFPAKVDADEKANRFSRVRLNMKITCGWV